MLTLKQAAAEYGPTVWTWRRYINQGFLPFVQPSGRGGAILLRRSDIDAFFERGCTPATAGPLAGGGE